MVKNFALIKNGVVVNTVSWDGEGDMFGDYDYRVDVTDTNIGINWIYDGENFTQPKKTKEQLEYEEQQTIASNTEYKAYLMSEASQKVSILQDAVDLEIATDEEVRILPLWKKYRVLLSRTNAETTEQIDWPQKPV